MGIDAEYLVVVPDGAPVTEDEIEALGPRIRQAFPYFDFSGGVEKIEDPNELLDVPDERVFAGDEHVYRIRTMRRYFGVGYLRGDFPTLFLIGSWLEVNAPWARIRYGGDHFFPPPPFDAEAKRELIDAFCQLEAAAARAR